MNKLERLEWIERTFGPEFVSPYFYCQNWQEICDAIFTFESRERTYGIRTDLSDGHVQGYQLPFVWKADRSSAKELWLAHGNKLVYIVCENVPRRRLSAVAQKLDSEHVLFEFNDKEPEQHQRHMALRPENVRQIALGPNRYVIPWEGLIVRCVDPVDASYYRFDEIYDVLIHSDQDEATFCVREDGRIVVW